MTNDGRVVIMQAGDYIGANNLFSILIARLRHRLGQKTKKNSHVVIRDNSVLEA